MSDSFVLVVGSVNRDRLVKVERLPEPGETVVGGSPLLASGGKGGNQAVAAARSGAKVALVTSFGDDLDGAALRDSLGADGIDLRFAVTSAEEPTGTASILVDADSRNVIVVSPGANNELTAAAAERAIMAARPRVLGLSLEVPAETALAAARIAQREGILVVSNVSPSSPVDRDLSALSSVVLVNEIEAATLFGTDVSEGNSPADFHEILRAAGDLGSPRVVITRGAKDTVILNVETSAVDIVPARRVRAVDTTGCGDAFAGALLARLAEGDDLVTASRFATTVAALAATKEGAQPSYPFLSDLRVFDEI